MTKYLAPALCVIFLHSCTITQTGTPIPRPDTPSSAAATSPLPSLAQVLSLNSAESELLIHVYRSGRLARLGHNHIIAARNLKGIIYYHPNPSFAGFDIAFPVESLELDNPILRERAGPDFNKPLNASDITATRRNMLSDKVLDAKHHPFVHIRSRSLTGEPPALDAQITVTLKGVSHDIPLQLNLYRIENRLIAQGTLTVSQQTFGIKPFSILAGAISIKDQLDISYRLVANIPVDDLGTP